MSIRAGMCIELQSSRNGMWHPYIVITEPEGNPLEVAVVNFTEYKANVDETAIFEAGEHPRLGKKSMINYMEGQVVPVDGLERLIKRHPHRLHEECEPAILKKIQDGVEKSRATRPKFLEYCKGKC